MNCFFSLTRVSVLEKKCPKITLSLLSKMSLLRVSAINVIYHVCGCISYLCLYINNSIQQEQGHYCGHNKGPGAPSDRPHFVTDDTSCTTDAESPAALCQVKTYSVSR